MENRLEGHQVTKRGAKMGTWGTKLHVDRGMIESRYSNSCYPEQGVQVRVGIGARVRVDLKLGLGLATALALGLGLGSGESEGEGQDERYG